MTRARILLTTSGRKSYLAPLFKASPMCGAVVAADCDPDSPIRYRADHFETVPPCDDGEAYVEALLAICRTHEIDCVLPLNDRDLDILARARGRFHKQGVLVAGLEPLDVGLVGDKFELAAWMAEHGFAYPQTWLDYPTSASLADKKLVEKSRYGQGSAGLAYHTHVPEQSLAPNQVVQEYLDGDEYNLDVLRDAHGQVVAVSVKQKLEMIGGSTDRAVSIRSPELCRLGARLADELCALGSIDVDVIVSRGRAFVIDINPRLGGGFPFTATYCPRYVDLLLEVCLGRSVGPFFPDYEHGLLVCREHTYSTSSTQREAGDPRFAAPEIAEENE